MKRFVLSIGILLAFASLTNAAPPVVVRTSHAGEITDMVTSTDAGLLFTGGLDGKINVWSIHDDRLLQSIQVDRFPVQKIALYPDGERVAVFSGDGKANQISVWNWNDGTRLFVRQIDDQAIHFDVSPLGSYLFYSTPRLQSVRFLDGSSGRLLPFMQQPTGIVSWATISRSEERILTYVPSDGVLTYYDIVTGETVGRFSSTRDLTALTLLDQRRYAAAIGPAGHLAVIDLLTGQIAAESPAGEITALLFDPVSADILVLATDFSGARSWRRFAFNQDTIQRRYTPQRNVPDGITAFTTAGREIIAGTRTGTLYRWLPYESDPAEIASPILVRVEDIALSQNRLHLLTADGVISLSSDAFGLSTETLNRATYVRERTTPVTAGANARFIERDGLNMFLWTPENQDAPLQRYRFYGAALPLGFPLPGTPRYITADSESLLVINRTGVLSLYDAEGAPVFQYRGIGLQAAAITNRGIVAGQAAQGLLGTSLLRLSPQTGETVPIAADAKMVFDLEYDESRGRLFTLGVRTNANSRVSTVLQLHTGSGFDSSRVVLEVPGEQLNATMTIEEVSGDVYTTLDDRGGILRWDGLRVSELSRNPSHIPDQLRILGNFLYSANTDGTVSVFDLNRGTLVFDIVLVRAGVRTGWIAVSPDGGFFTPDDFVARSAVVSRNGGYRLLLGDG